MRFGSLFAGIGGFDLGLERAGMKCAWQVEIDDYASRVLAKHWPNVPRWGDVRTFPVDDPVEWEVDLICAGVPCQPVSIAGKQKGADDERWMWGEALRVIADLNPRFFVAENPSSILSHDQGRTFGGIIRALATAGYVCEWHIISAADVGAPHRRERVWLVARKDASLGSVPMLQKLLVPDSRDACSRLHVPAKRRVGKQSVLAPHSLADSSSKRLERAVLEHASKRLPGSCSGAGRDEKQDLPKASEGWWQAEPAVGRVAHGIPRRVDRLRCLGNAIVPQIVELIGRAIIEFDEANA